MGKLVADLQLACRPYCLGVSASGQIQRIASVLALTRADKRALFCEVRQIAGSGCGRRASDRAVVARAHSALEPVWAFPEDSQERLLLPVIDVAAQPVQ